MGQPEFLWLKAPQQKSVRLGLIAAAAGVFLLILLNAASRPAAVPERVPLTAPAAPAAAVETPAGMEAALGSELAAILSAVEGAGRVRVQVSLDGGVERVFALDRTRNATTTEERDRSGGLRVITQDDAQDKVVAVQGGGGQEALVRQVLRPQVRGVLVVAEGAGEPAVRDRLARAVQTALGVPLYRVTVLAGQTGGGGEVQ